MTQERLVTLRLPDDLIAALSGVARVEGCAPADLLRDAVAASLRQRAVAADPIPADVAAAFRAAPDWPGLQAKLRRLGFVLRLDGADHLSLFSWPRERCVMPVERLGHTLTTLCLRFHAPFPGAAPAVPEDTGSALGAVLARMRGSPGDRHSAA